MGNDGVRREPTCFELLHGLGAGNTAQNFSLKVPCRFHLGELLGGLGGLGLISDVPDAWQRTPLDTKRHNLVAQTNQSAGNMPAGRRGS